ncbi:hypothetical protein [Peribacillus sp. B2I2]|uniref:hypothetical protein n=1 Tax=Peribacillus sp. B2I2 TaxID=3156468 RepID=UPI0035152C02
MDVAIILFILTALGYMTTYIYELGYKYYFSLPSNLIDLSLTNITRSIIFVSFFFGFAFLVDFYNNETKVKERRRKININITKIYALLSLIAFSLIVNGQFNPIDAVIILVALIILFLLFIFKPSKLLLYIMLFAYFIILTFKLGYNFADKSEYLVIKDDDLVVIDYYQDRAIVAKADLKKKVIYPEYQFIKLETDEIGKVKFELINTGKMKLERKE